MSSTQWVLRADTKGKVTFQKGTDSLFECSFGECFQLFSNVLMAPLPSLSLYIIYFSTYIN